MVVPVKTLWKADASSGDASHAIDGRYSTSWISEPSQNAWFHIDLGDAAALRGLEVYWGRHFAVVYDFETSLDGATWFHLCGTRYGEGGQDVFAFPLTHARFLRWTCRDQALEKGLEVVELNLYDPERRHGSSKRAQPMFRHAVGRSLRSRHADLRQGRAQLGVAHVSPPPPVVPLE